MKEKNKNDTQSSGFGDTDVIQGDTKNKRERWE